jgi:FeS assembly SUF system protein
MKPLPVIQPPPPKPSANVADAREAHEGGHPLQTAGIVDDPEQSAALKPRIIKAVSTVFDPEIPVNIYDLGLIYDVIVDSSRRVGIRMTLTAPACPAAQFLPDRVKKAVEAVPEITDVAVDVVWEPPWTRDRMSDAAKLQLGMF